MTFIFLSSLIVFLDQLSKFLFRRYLDVQQTLPIIKNVFHLTLVYNRGAAFGILKNQTPLFIMVAVFALAMLYFDFRENKSRGRLYDVALSFIAGGAIGNLIDRIGLGYVVDFLDLRIWPVFNLADSFITIGAILLFCYFVKNPDIK